MTTVLRRMFNSRSHKPLAGIYQRTKLIEENEMDDFEADDISELETDFMNVGESHKAYKREMRAQKEHLKQKIVIQKYFKEKEPRFITFTEKELICKLHESNPDEWTLERLSESFPALPETIKKILNSKWSPESVEKVVQYDNVAIQNWKKFQAGKLPLTPMLKEHLTKFKDRKIISTDRESLAKQFVPNIKFQKSKSTLFASIVQTHLNEKKNDTKLLSQEDPSKVEDTSDEPDKIQNLLDTDIKINNKLQTELEESDTAPFNKKKNKLFTFDEFVKVNLKDIQKESPEEGIALLNIQREQMDASQEIQTAAITTVSDNAITHKREDIVSKIAENSDSVSIIPKNKRDFNIVTTDDNLLDTSIKVWNKKIDMELNYTKPIKIAKNLYKSGMTYRINDCYYDDDGEFLYRVPGVQN